MVEKITVNPESIRAYGNIITPKTSTDFSLYGEDYNIIESTDTVYGAEASVFEMKSKYNVSFNSESYTTSSSSLLVQVTVLDGTTPVTTGTVTVTGAGGSGSGTLIISGGGVANIAVTGINQSGTLIATYKNAKATATVTYEPVSYSLAFSQSTYTYDFIDDEVVLSCTLKNGNTPMSGETITFNYQTFGPETGTATTNSNGVATYTVYGMDLSDETITATYEGVTATCRVVGGL